MKNLKLNFAFFCMLAMLAVTVCFTSCGKEEVSQVAAEETLITDYEKAAELLDAYIVEENGIFTMTVSDPGEFNIDPTVFEELVKGLEDMNQQIESGEIEKEWIGKAYDIDTRAEVPVESRGCNENKTTYHWWGKTTYISNYRLNLAASAANLGIAVTIFFPGAQPVAGAFAIASAAISFGSATCSPCGIKIYSVGRVNSIPVAPLCQ